MVSIKNFRSIKKWSLHILLFYLIPAISWGVAKISYPSDAALYDWYPWSLTYYYGVTCEDRLLRITKFGIHRWPEHIQSLELSHTLDQQNFLRQLVSPIVSVVQFAGNFTVRVGSNQSTIYELDPYLAFRWANLPWDHYVNTSFALGEGVSYVTSYPSLEKHANHSNTRRFLNYLMFEATVASPALPRVQLLIRIHHRSGAFGLYRAKNAGSNDIGLGLRFLFD
jgi:hypothetical protein